MNQRYGTLGMPDWEAAARARSLPEGDAAGAEAALREVLASMSGSPYDPAWRVLHVYEPDPGGSGHRAAVLVLRAPALSYRVTCPGLDLDLMTGSGEGMGELATAIADAIAGDLLGRAPGEGR